MDGALRCIGNPKELTARYGGFYILTITSEHGREGAVSDLVHTMAQDVRITCEPMPLPATAHARAHARARDYRCTDTHSRVCIACEPIPAYKHKHTHALADTREHVRSYHYVRITCEPAPAYAA